MGKKIFWSIFALLFVLFWVEIFDSLSFADHRTAPFVDLKAVAEKAELQEADYKLIFSQTGLGRVAVDDLKASDENFYQTLASFQQQKRLPATYERRYLFFPTTTADVLVNDEGDFRTLTIPPLKDGDVLLTKSTKTLVYRHGHAALVTDAERGAAMEAMMIGTVSAQTSVDSWGSYATLMVLGPKTKAEQTKKALNFAGRNLLHVPYHLFAGFMNKDKSNVVPVNYTYCSHLVWQAYKATGLDLDTDGGWLVSPCDISASSDLEVVFSYGFGEDGKW